MRLAGDIGGTKTDLGLFAASETGRARCLASNSFPSGDYGTFEEMLEDFLSRHPPEGPLRGTCLGVAGPVVDNRCRTTNLPWRLEGAELGRRFPLGPVELVNDLVATAEGIAALEPGDFVELLPGAREPDPRRPAALLAVGTGLGMAILAPGDHEGWRPLASEGGHVELAPRNDEEDALLRYLRRLFPDHVSIERVVSGPGLLTLYRFLATRGGELDAHVAARIDADESTAPAAISAAGLNGSCPRCGRALEIFIGLLASAAANLALTLVATGGVFLGGGICPRILPALRGELFRESFLSKGRYRYLLETLPVRVITERRTALFGAALRAGRLS